MKILYIIIAIILIVSISWIVYTSKVDNRSRDADNNSYAPSEIVQLGKEFQEKKGPFHDPATAKKLAPHLKVGMSKQQIESLLGKPDEQSGNGNEEYYYHLSLSTYIAVRFYKDDKVILVEGLE